MSKRLQVVSFLALAAGAYAQDPEYYKNIDFSLTNAELKQQLHELINPHTVLSYDDAWDVFSVLDKNLPTYPCDDSNPSYIPDVYSNNCWIPEKVTGGQCGNYKQEGDCYNREHSWPKSWFGGFDAGHGAESDLFELYPTDGYVNGLRGNVPLGYVDVSRPIAYTSTNGALLGSCLSDSVDASGVVRGVSTRETGGTKVDRSHLVQKAKNERVVRRQKRKSVESKELKELARKYAVNEEGEGEGSSSGMLAKLRDWILNKLQQHGGAALTGNWTDDDGNFPEEDDASNFEDDFWKADDDYAYGGTCFEIADMYKGDFARSYFYLSTAYMDVWTCCDDVAVNAWDIKPWMEREMREWHELDPVDSYEVARNNLIYSDYQHNRNPFIDYPELVDQINDF